jgi:hypothetical protein
MILGVNRVISLNSINQLFYKWLSFVFFEVRAEFWNII